MGTLFRTAVAVGGLMIACILVYQLEMLPTVEVRWSNDEDYHESGVFFQERDTNGKHTLDGAWLNGDYEYTMRQGSKGAVQQVEAAADADAEDYLDDDAPMYTDKEMEAESFSELLRVPSPRPRPASPDRTDQRQSTGAQPSRSPVVTPPPRRPVGEERPPLTGSLYEPAACNIPDEPIQVQVSLPEEMIHCKLVTIPLQVIGGSAQLPKLDCPMAALNLTCEITVDYMERAEEINLFRRMPPFSRTFFSVRSMGSDHQEFTFYPDEVMDSCTLAVYSVMENVEIVGETVAESQASRVIEVETWKYCYHCKAVLSMGLPLPYEFSLYKDEQWVWDWPREVQMEQGESLQLWVRPMPWMLEYYGEDVMTDLTFNGILLSHDVIQTAPISSHWNREFGGYELNVRILDVGLYQLRVTLNEIWGSSEPLSSEPHPVCLSSHLRHEYADCDMDRSLVYGSDVSIYVRQVQGEVPIFHKAHPKRCTSPNEPGRWLGILDKNLPCEPPVCTGDRKASMVTDQSWMGAVYDYVWVPYNCYFHLYSPDDVSYCAKEAGISWIHVMGDSLSRELEAYLTSFYHLEDTIRFAYADSILNDDGLKISFLAWLDIFTSHLEEETDGPEHFRRPSFTEQILNHFNFFIDDASSDLYLDFEHLQLERQEGSPQVFIMNPAMAYVLGGMTEKSYIAYLDMVLDFTEEMCTVGTDGRPPVMCIWYGQPFIFAASTDEGVYMTQKRNARYRELTVPRVEAHGYRYFDPIPITASRPEESWDGLHYLRGYLEWNGHVASMNQQIVLNMIFGSCTGRPDN